MDNETIKILEEQAGKIPTKVIDFLSSSDWESALNNISASFNLSSEISNKLKKEAILVLAGLIHPDSFRDEIKEQIGGDLATIDSLATEVEEKIFAPIRADLVEFFEEQEVEEETQENLEEKNIPSKTWEKMPDVAPDNLPTGEEVENLIIPNLIPKAISEEKNAEKKEGTHPFEEKMKKVFTGARATMGDLVIETPAPEENISISNDIYREPLE